MTLRLETLKSEIKEGVKKTFIQLANKTPQIYSYALYSDENCETIGCVSNTIEHLDKKKSSSNSSTENFFKYSPDEWDFSLTNDLKEDEFLKISKQLYDNNDNFSFETTEDEELFEKFQKDFYQMCIEVLKELKSESFFKNHFPKDIFILFSVSEYEFEESQEIEMIKALNDNKYGDEYIKWIKEVNIQGKIIKTPII